jgi:uncharacterized membrane protein YoaK (UPF0700 family)
MTARDERVLPAALLGLTAVTGLVDAVSYLALGHVFTANMTGNVVLLGFAVAGAPGLSVTRSGSAVAAFFIGAVIGGRMAARMSGRRDRWTGAAFGAEAALFLAAMAVALTGAGSRMSRRGSTASSCSPASPWAFAMPRYGSWRCLTSPPPY